MGRIIDEHEEDYRVVLLLTPLRVSCSHVGVTSRTLLVLTE